MDKFVHVSFFFTRKELGDNREITLVLNVTGQNLTVPLLLLALDMSPPHWYRWMREGNTENHAYRRA